MSIQISISNAIGSRYRGSVVPPIDPDAQAFITAASITDPTQQAAINTLVVDLKGYSIWTKMKAIYPFCGSTASQHKWNLRDPRDLDAAFRLVFNGGWTHSSTGATPNGTNAYADTKIALNTLTRDSNSSGVYIRTNVVEDKTDYGIFDTGSQGSLHFGSRVIGNLMGGRNGSSTSDTTSNNDSRGLFQMTRRNSSNYVISKNTTKTTITRAATDLFSNATKIPLGCLAFGTPTFFSSKQFAFFYIGNTSLSDSELDNLYTAVQAFQTTLGRSIGTQTVSDADAQAFVTNAGIVDQVEANAINNLVIGMKADGLWTKMKAVYPFVGGTSTSTSYNLRNTAQYQISWIGGWTWNNNGALPGGVNGYGETNLNENSVLTLNNAHISVYLRTNSSLNSADIGAFDGTYQSNILPRFSNELYGRIHDTSAAATTNLDSKGYYIANRTNSSQVFVYKNTTKYTLSSTATNKVNNTFVFSRISQTVGNYSDRQIAFSTIGDGLTDTDAANLNTRVTTFQTALNRNV